MKWSREQAIALFRRQRRRRAGLRRPRGRTLLRAAGTGVQLQDRPHRLGERRATRDQAALGAKYDIKDFHDAGLNCGRVPLDVLDGVIDRYIKTKAA